MSSWFFGLRAIMSPAFGEPASLSGAEILMRDMSVPGIHCASSAICVRRYCLNSSIGHSVWIEKGRAFRPSPKLHLPNLRRRADLRKGPLPVVRGFVLDEDDDFGVGDIFEAFGHAAAF